MSVTILISVLTVVSFVKLGENRVALPTSASIGELDVNVKRYERSGCSIAVNEDLVEPQPLFVVPRTNKFWNPSPNGTILIPSRASIELFCTKNFSKPFAERQLIRASCLYDNVFMVENKKYDFDEFTCTSQNFHTARRTGELCHGNASLIEIGFNAGYRFLRTMLICHDEINQATFYVHHKLNPSSAAYQRYVPRPSFIEGDFYQKKNVNHLYTKVKQMETIGTILSGDHEKYFDEKKSLYLARGHLSAKVDHIFGTQQRTTFYFINAAPQWQRFNAGNWERVEDGVRKFVAKNKMDVDCYTGTWGVSKLSDANGDSQQLFLSFDENNNGQIPVPMLYYRIVVEPATKRGIVLIGVNNPHVSLKELEEEYIICEDISNLVKWINWKKKDILSGYSYACEVNQFKKVVQHVPELDVKGILY